MRLNPLPIAITCLSLLSAAAAQAASVGLPTLNGQLPIVIGHRGAPGYLPDHTLAGYAKAIELGANYIEPDVVMTMDGQLIARHEPMLGGTTNVAAHPEFAARKTTKMVDGVSTTDWFASDFTLAEIKTLRAIQPLANRPQGFNGLYEIPTLNEVIALAQAQSIATGRTIGIYPEIKHSMFHAALFGANVFENKLLGAVHAAYGNVATAPVFIQSFEVSNLKYLNTQTQIKLVQLIDADDVNADGSMSLVAPYDKPYDFVINNDKRTFADLLTDKGLDELATYVDGVGPWKPYLVKTVDDGVDRDGDNVLTIKDRRVDGPTGVIAAAHARGLLVHTWTFRNDRSGYGFADPRAEMAYYMNLGVDGVFTDFADTGVAAVASVPEPETYALMALGLGLVVLTARRRK